MTLRAHVILLILLSFSTAALAQASAVNWIEKAADWIWLLTVAIAGVAWRTLMRIGRLEARTSALEDHHQQRLRAIQEINSKIDNNQSLVMSKLDGLRDEIREDIRLILNAIMPGGGHGR